MLLSRAQLYASLSWYILIFSYSHIQIDVLSFNVRFLEYDLNLIVTKNSAIAIIWNIKYLFEYYEQFNYSHVQTFIIILFTEI